MEEKNKVWRPFGSYKYTPEELYKEAMAYFDYCDNELVENAYWKKVWKPKTLTWLAKWLWVAKDYISEQLKREDFSEMIKYIRWVVENDIEEKAMLWVYNPTIASKNLSANFDWKDKSEVKQENTNVDVTDTLTEEQKKLIANRILNGKSSSTTNERSE
jgi:hypothetical protein